MSRSILKRLKLTTPPSTEAAPTIAELKGRTYATFTDSGVAVDLGRFFASDSGKKAVSEVVKGVKFYNPKPKL